MDNRIVLRLMYDIVKITFEIIKNGVKWFVNVLNRKK